MFNPRWTIGKYWSRCCWVAKSISKSCSIVIYFFVCLFFFWLNKFYFYFVSASKKPKRSKMDKHSKKSHLKIKNNSFLFKYIQKYNEKFYFFLKKKFNFIILISFSWQRNSRSTTSSFSILFNKHSRPKERRRRRRSLFMLLFMYLLYNLYDFSWNYCWHCIRCQINKLKLLILTLFFQKNKLLSFNVWIIIIKLLLLWLWLLFICNNLKRSFKATQPSLWDCQWFLFQSNKQLIFVLFATHLCQLSQSHQLPLDQWPRPKYHHTQQSTSFISFERKKIKKIIFFFCGLSNLLCVVFRELFFDKKDQEWHIVSNHDHPMLLLPITFLYIHSKFKLIFNFFSTKQKKKKKQQQQQQQQQQQTLNFIP